MIDAKLLSEMNDAYIQVDPDYRLIQALTPVVGATQQKISEVAKAKKHFMQSPWDYSALIARNTKV